MIESEFEYIEKNNGSKERLAVRYILYTAKDILRMYTTNVDYDYIYSETTLSQSLKRLKDLYNSQHQYTVSFFKGNSIDLSSISLNDIINNGYVALKQKREIKESDIIDSHIQPKVGDRGAMYYPVKLFPISVANTATLLAYLERFKGNRTEKGEIVFSPEVGKSNTPIEDLPMASLSQSVKLLKLLKQCKQNVYIDIVENIFGNTKKFSVNDIFNYEEIASFLSTKSQGYNETTVHIDGEELFVIPIKRFCLKSTILSLISKLVMDNPSQAYLLSKYEDILKFNNRKLLIKPKESKQKKNPSPKKSRREWVHIIYTPMGLGKRR